jgi:spheroidene monooxygenase
LFCVFSTEEHALDWLTQSTTLQQYREHTSELFVACLQPVSSRGSWSGHTLQVEAAPLQPDERLAALTRASIKPMRAARFWRHAPPAEHDLAAAAGCRLAVGLGEAPLVRQATFSIWDNTAAMDAYARSGAHLTAFPNRCLSAFGFCTLRAAGRASIARRFCDHTVRGTPCHRDWRRHGRSGCSL